MLEELKLVAAAFPGRGSIYFRDVQQGTEIRIHSDYEYKAASLIKLPLAMHLAQLIGSGRYDLDMPVPITEENRVGGTGIMQYLNRQYVPTLRELLFFMISQSDNLATNMIVDLCGGIAAVNRYIGEELGIPHTAMRRKMMDMDAAARGEENVTSAESIGEVLLRVITKKEEDETLRFLWEALKSQQCRNKLPSLIPAEDTYGLAGKDIADPGQVIVANKTGDLWTTQHDAGIFVLPDGRSYILVVCTDQLSQAQEGCQWIARVSELVYRHMAQ